MHSLYITSGAVCGAKHCKIKPIFKPWSMQIDDSRYNKPECTAIPAASEELVGQDDGAKQRHSCASCSQRLRGQHSKEELILEIENIHEEIANVDIIKPRYCEEKSRQIIGSRTSSETDGSHTSRPCF